VKAAIGSRISWCRAATLLAVIFAVFLMTEWGLSLFRESRAHSVYNAAEMGDSERTIIGRLGEPDQIETCGEFLWWDGGQSHPARNDGRCQKWVRYNFFLHAFAFG